jgi:hypothetical protein
MGYTRQPGEDADTDQDPLSPYSAPTIRRSTDRGSTQPLEDLGGLPRGSGMQVDGADFAGRSQQRRQRQAGAQIYTQRIGEMTQRFDNRMLMYGLGAILVLLSLALVWRAMSRNDEVNAVDDLSATAAAAEEATPIFAEPASGAFSTVQPGVDPGTGIGTEAQPIPTTGGAAPTGGAFVVAGTGTEGLFLRAEANASANVLATLPEGTEVQATGEENNDGTRTWRRVQTPQGEGWVAADFLIPKP